MKNTVRLYLPDGGSFDLPASSYGDRIAVNGLGAPNPVADAPWGVIAVGALLGGLFTWLITRLDR